MIESKVRVQRESQELQTWTAVLTWLGLVSEVWQQYKNKTKQNQPVRANCLPNAYDNDLR